SAGKLSAWTRRRTAAPTTARPTNVIASPIVTDRALTIRCTRRSTSESRGLRPLSTIPSPFRAGLPAAHQDPDNHEHCPGATLRQAAGCMWLRRRATADLRLEETRAARRRPVSQDGRTSADLPGTPREERAPRPGSMDEALDSRAGVAGMNAARDLRYRR